MMTIHERKIACVILAINYLGAPESPNITYTKSVDFHCSWNYNVTQAPRFGLPYLPSPGTPLCNLSNKGQATKSVTIALGMQSGMTRALLYHQSR